MQKHFAQKVITTLQNDPNILGLAAGGSWIQNKLDEYSDLDLILVTKKKISGDKEKMLSYAKSFGDFISGFTGEHVGEPRLLICLYDNPLLHVDIKFLTLEELKERIEDPDVLFERDKQLSNLIKTTKPVKLETDLQWLEDRFWTWIHYTATKIGRGEYFEALNTIEFLRSQVLTPLMHLKNKSGTRGARRAEMILLPPDLENLKITVAQYNRASVIKALDNIISIYKSLRRKLFDEKIELQKRAERKSLDYFNAIKSKK